VKRPPRSPKPETTSEAAARAWAGVRSLTLDVTPLKASRDFRLLWVGRLVSETGRQITLVALFVQVFDLTGSPAAVGLIGIAQVVPLIIATLGAGTIVDHLDRRKILIATQWGQTGASAVLLAGALMETPPLALVYGAAAASSVFSGVDGPTRSAIIPNLVGRRQLPAALALNQVMFQTTMIVGPFVGGLIIGVFGLAWAYGIDVVTFAAGIAAAMLIRPMPPERGEQPATGFAAVREGFTYLKGKRVLQSTFIADLIAMIFGSPRSLFPVLAATQFDQGPQVVGMLFAAPAVGALVGSLTSGWVERIRRQGLAVLVAVAAWGLAIAGFGLSDGLLPLALLLLAFAGAADVISAVFRSTILHLSIPDSLRGRLSAIHILVVTGGPRIGDFEAGAVASLVSPAFSVVSGGIACVIGIGVMALKVPEFRRYIPPEYPEAKRGK
jgi:MFS family permease